jgi:hypothetical protein
MEKYLCFLGIGAINFIIISKSKLFVASYLLSYVTETQKYSSIVAIISEFYHLHLS